MSKRLISCSAKEFIDMKLKEYVSTKLREQLARVSDLNVKQIDTVDPLKSYLVVEYNGVVQTFRITLSEVRS